MQEEWRREGRVVSQRNILFLLSRHNQLSSGEAIGAGYQMLVFIKPFPGAALRGGWGGGCLGQPGEAEQWVYLLLAEPQLLRELRELYAGQAPVTTVFSPPRETTGFWGDARQCPWKQLIAYLPGVWLLGRGGLGRF